LLPSKGEGKIQEKGALLIGCDKLYLFSPRIGKDIDKEKERILIEDDPSGHGRQHPVI
jgi:hypothetical protein